ncbi:MULTISPECIES: UDP-2,3-diacylglucosamine diphosphatase [unclassified Colwellia]|uniref:UDP-2,3-diacylglucosamine diphosphatase n=1 Tax=unclassified Colwellia TaxID=196834 RepID=UPI0015F68035|nr:MULTISPECIES: UDP-2,3-diacylglucosamine diphosphatase [unclassified Colwellia]MBA6254294.1 UDP-2,3-diacylglucosamine diphosphatase [Colwellia sp. MB3u-55]MBA6396629.1 UDP-2,3-diacylglucosamine diphosphatase [Colwellia sp. BRX10-4]
MTSTVLKESVTYFIADLHLAQNRPDITACFLSFLENDAPKAETLYILGDLFEYWIGDDDTNPFVINVSNALKTLSKLGTRIYYIHGNRDFLLGKKYAKACGMLLLPEIDLINLYGKPVVIMHGDTLCTRDIAYQAFRKKSRSWWWQAIIKNLPLFIRRKIAENYRIKSASATAMKSQEIMDVTETEVINALESYKSQLMIHGHTHRPNIHNIQVNNAPAQRIVLGDWYEQGAWLKVTENSIKLLSQAFKTD